MKALLIIAAPVGEEPRRRERRNMKKYLLDEKPIGFVDLIRAAAKIDDDFRKEQLRTTSQAAAILRRFGHSVEENRKGGT